MVISFEQKLAQKKGKVAYRDELVDKIVKWHEENEQDEPKGDFYLDHLRQGLPLHMLEQIAERLSV